MQKGDPGIQSRQRELSPTSVRGRLSLPKPFSRGWMNGMLLKQMTSVRLAAVALRSTCRNFPSVVNQTGSLVISQPFVVEI